jgi:hypothetical protein
MPLFGEVPCVFKIDNSLGLVGGSLDCPGSHHEKRQKGYTTQSNEAPHLASFSGSHVQSIDADLCYLKLLNLGEYPYQRPYSTHGLP